MASVYQQYLGQFYLDTTMNDFVVARGSSSNAIALTNAVYWIAGYTGESNANITCLCEHITNKITSATGAIVKCNVTYNGSTGFVTMQFNAATNITWTDSALQSLLGFSGSQINAQSYTATRKPRYVWRPTNPPRDYTGLPETGFQNPKTTTRYIRAKDGTVHSVVGNLLYDVKTSYQYLLDGEVHKSNPDNYTSLQSFYEDVIQNGYRVRVYPDRTYNNSASFVECTWGEEDPKTFEEYVKRDFDKYQGYYSGNLTFWKVV